MGSLSVSQKYKLILSKLSDGVAEELAQALTAAEDALPDESEVVALRERVKELERMLGETEGIEVSGKLGHGVIEKWILEFDPEPSAHFGEYSRSEFAKFLSAKLFAFYKEMKELEDTPAPPPAPTREEREKKIWRWVYKRDLAEAIIDDTDAAIERAIEALRRELKNG